MSRRWPPTAPSTRSTSPATAALPSRSETASSASSSPPCAASWIVRASRAHLAGHSMGGLVAAALALEDPGRVLSLTLVDSAGLGPEINLDYIEGFVAASGRRELKPVLQRLFADPDLVTRQMIDDVLKYKRLDGVQEALRALADRLFADGRQQLVLTDELRSFQSPMLVIWGNQDQVIPVAHANAAPESAETKVLPGAGHSPHMEAAGDFNRTLEGFLAGVRAG